MKMLEDLKKKSSNKIDVLATDVHFLNSVLSVGQKFHLTRCATVWDNGCIARKNCECDCVTLLGKSLSGNGDDR